MPDFDFALEELVTANRILAHEGVVDGFGHVTVRHPQRPDRFLMSRARAPDCVEVEDLMEFALDGTAIDPKGRKPYLERFIHGAVYEARPEIMSVVHNHSPSTIPFGITPVRLRPLMHMCATIGHEVPVWDIRDRFGDTSLLVTDMEMGRDLAKALGPRPTALMRGHGCVVAAESLRKCVWVSIYLELNANLQMKAMAMGEVKFLSPGEVDAVMARTSGFTLDRAWEYWCRRAGRPAHRLEIN
ncbi:MAG TPA: class II aldolase/adducin family protein [Xanthobacteraceae bacterium]|nr:class II aldolase/adducin family protein [Xanthobacteraceae bacterium]